MSIELLKTNIAKEKQIVKDLYNLFDRFDKVQSSKDKEKIRSGIIAYYNQIRILNNSIPDILKEISIAKKLPSDSKVETNKKTNLVNVSYDVGNGEELVSISASQKNKYLEELRISKESLKGLGNDEDEKNDWENIYKKPSFYIKLSNKFFGKNARELTKKGKFRNLGESLRKGGFIFLLHSYVAVMFFSTLLAFVFGIFLSALVFVFTMSFHSFWIILLLPLITFFSIWYYPSSEVTSREKMLDLELPFVTIQMSAIASADIEPSNIFKIIALNKEYKYINKEAKKLMNQINLYGYDLVTALRNVAHSSPSKDWADLLNGIATTIKSGGNLSKYLDKRAEGFLFDYRLDQEKSTRVAETFMDIYIAIVIAAPLLLMLLLVLMSISNIGLPLGVGAIALIMVGLVAIINLLFLTFLQLRQGSG
jgi:Flp pilus assembly protein TadB